MDKERTSSNKVLALNNGSKEINEKPLILCVTGPMAAGKNVASDILVHKGFAAVDADVLAHTAVENAKEKILSTFEPLARERNITLTNSDGTVNRRALGKLIFADETLVAKQERIVFPEVNRLFDEFIAQHKEQNIVINATVLYKVPLISKVDYILYIDAPYVQRWLRAKRRDHIPSKQIKERFFQQRYLFAKYKNCTADIVRVWNTGTRFSLEKKIDKFLTKCRQGI